MVRFLWFNGHVASHKPKKAAASSSDNLVPSTSKNQPKSLSSPNSMISVNHGNVGTNRIATMEKDSSSVERACKSDDVMSKMGDGESRGVFQTGQLKKSPSLESRLEKKGKTHVDPADGKSDNGSYSDEIVIESGLTTLETYPSCPPTEGCAVTLPNKPSIFSIGDLKNTENGRHENCAADIPHSDNSKDSGEVPHSDNGKNSGVVTPHTPPLIIRLCSLPNIHASLVPSFGFSREFQQLSRSSEDLLVLVLRHNETSNYEQTIQLRPTEGGAVAYDYQNLGFRNEDDDGYANANYRDPSRHRIVPDLKEVQLKSLWDVGLPLDDSPGKDFKIKRIQKWVIDLQPCSPSEDADESSQLKDETVKDHVSEDEIEVKADFKASTGMEAAKRYISSLTASATACQLGNHGLEVIPFLSAFVSLKMLNLSGNNIVRITAGVLPRGLHALNLSRNRISTIEGLRELTRLRVLDLSYNRIFRIGHGLASCSSLKELYLAGNKISEVEGLHRLLKLNMLDLRFNKISTTKCLSQLAANYNSLQAVSLEGNPAQKNIGGEQVKKHLQGLLPHLAYFNKLPVKVGTLKDSSERMVRLGGSTSQFDRNLRPDAKSSRKGGHNVISKPSS